MKFNPLSADNMEKDLKSFSYHLLREFDSTKDTLKNIHKHTEHSRIRV